MGLAPGAALVPARQRAQLRESCVSIRDPGKKCGLGVAYPEIQLNNHYRCGWLFYRRFVFEAGVARL